MPEFQPLGSLRHDERCRCPVCAGLSQDDELLTKIGISADLTKTERLKLVVKGTDYKQFNQIVDVIQAELDADEQFKDVVFKTRYSGGVGVIVLWRECELGRN